LELGGLAAGIFSLNSKPFVLAFKVLRPPNQTGSSALGLIFALTLCLEWIWRTKAGTSWTQCQVAMLLCCGGLASIVEAE